MQKDYCLPPRGTNRVDAGLLAWSSQIHEVEDRRFPCSIIRCIPHQEGGLLVGEIHSKLGPPPCYGGSKKMMYLIDRDVLR